MFSPPGLAADAPAVWVGSHIDSVPQGGNYDGLAGVVAGLLCLIARQREGHEGGPALRVLAFRGEESAGFGTAYMKSEERRGGKECGGTGRSRGWASSLK